MTDDGVGVALGVGLRGWGGKEVVGAWVVRGEVR